MPPHLSIPSRALGVVVVLCVASAAAAAPSAAAAGVERQFLDAQQRTRELYGQPDRVIALWHEFADRHTEHELGYVARLNQALWMLHAAADRQGNTDAKVREQALALLQWPEPTEPTEQGLHASPLYEQVYRAALSLRTRLEMIALAGKLQDYYRRHIEYPPSLEVLVDAGLVERERIVDAFGEPYRYSARARAIMPEIPRQAYTLRSASIDDDHRGLGRLLDGLDRPVEAIEVSTLAPDEGQAYVRERREDGSWSSARRWAVGQERAGYQLWAVYEAYLLVGWRGAPRVVRGSD